MKENKAVVVAVNDNYVPYLAVLVKSIIENTESTNLIDIIILYCILSEKNKNELSKIVEKEKNVTVCFKDVNAYFTDKELFVGGKDNSAYLSKETYFRLVTPQILPRYNKALYLDSDIVVQENWIRIFDIDIQDYYVAAVNDIWGNWECFLHNSELKKYRKEELNLENPVNYFNAGVLLINLDRFRKEYRENELIDLAMSRNWRKHDQDLLNYICKGNVKWLDYRWNLIECPSKKAKTTISCDEYERYMKSYNTPYIVHYATRKPWYILDMMYAELFWQYAFKTPYKEFLLKQFVKNQMISGPILENYVIEGIQARKIGVVFICKCIITWLKVTLWKK